MSRPIDRLALVLVPALLVAATAVVARADAIGPCPDGEEVVMNPSTPGSGHHGGFHCERHGGCSVTPGVPNGGLGPAPLLVGVAGFALAMRRR